MVQVQTWRGSYEPASRLSLPDDIPPVVREDKIA